MHSIPVYCVAFVCSLTCAWLSECLRQRYLFALFGALVTLIGLSIEIAQLDVVGARYAGMFFITAGTYITMPIMVVWTAINVGKGYKRTVAFGLVIATGNAGALISSNVFITKEAPKYPTGFSVGMGMNCLSIVCMTALYVGLRLENRRRNNRPADTVFEASDELTGEKHPSWRYQL